jgi:hypothetical protein
VAPQDGAKMTSAKSHAYLMKTAPSVGSKNAEGGVETADALVAAKRAMRGEDVECKAGVPALTNEG